MKKKEYLESACTLSWFLMDAAWMMGWNPVALGATLPTLILGLSLPLLEPDPDVRLIDISMFFWIAMNGAWLYSEILQVSDLLWLAKFNFALGGIFLIAATLKTGDLGGVLSRFRRFRFQRQNKVC